MSPGSRRGKYGGIQPAGGGLLANNNLTKAAYQTLTGPPLAPRRQYSRVITNAATTSYPDVRTPGIWYVELGWGDVVSPSGYSFLPVHFNGLPLGRGGPCRRRDLRGIRPETKELMLTAFRAWARLTIRGKAFMAELGL